MQEKLLEIARYRRETLKNRERKTKNAKGKTATVNIYFLLLIFYIEQFILCYKTYLKIVSLCCYICITIFFS